MSWDINQVVLVGRMVVDPELRYGKSGNVFLNLRLAVNKKSFKAEYPDESYYFDCIAFGKTAEVCAKYLCRGSQIGVMGSLRQRSWNDAESGNKRFKVEILVDRIQFLSNASGRRITESSDSDGFATSSSSRAGDIGLEEKNIDNQSKKLTVDTSFGEVNDDFGEIPF